MSPIGNDISGYLIILAFALIAHESWRWLGAFLGAQVGETDDVFVWVRYVSTALISALAMRIILFPSGALASVDLPFRVSALAIATCAFLVFQRNLAAGIVAGSASLVALSYALGSA
jgi:branched-subunit amino acid transport protein